MSFIARTCPWPLAGVSIGLFAVALQWIDNLPLGATGAAAGFLDWLRRPTWPPGWRAFFFAGTVAGGLFYSLVTHARTGGWSSGALAAALGRGRLAQAALLTVAGGLIGFGARWAGGCTSGHGICGVGRLQPASLAATLTFVSTAVLVAHLVWRGAPL